MIIIRLPQINLDDRTYDQLLSEALSLVAKEFPDVTDFYPSDPGITLIELFAYLFEAALYHMNCVPERSYRNFAGLLGIKPEKNEPIEMTLKKAIDSIGKSYRAITEDDIEKRAEDFIKKYCMENKIQLEYPFRVEVYPENKVINVIVIETEGKLPSGEIVPQLKNELKGSCPICTDLFIDVAKYNHIAIEVNVAADSKRYVNIEVLEKNIRASIEGYFDILNGGIDKKGWILGRSVYRSELYSIINRIKGIDYVKSMKIRNNCSNCSNDKLLKHHALNCMGCTDKYKMLFNAKDSSCPLVAYTGKRCLPRIAGVTVKIDDEIIRKKEK